jgi:psiF repeat-containing protein
MRLVSRIASRLPTLIEEGFMRPVLAIAVAVSLAAGTLSMASAADEKKANPQQERMKACNSEAGDKKGDERKAFLSQCLKGGAAMPMTQQEKMKKCNTDASAKSLKGDERKAFMSTCLKGDKM